MSNPLYPSLVPRYVDNSWFSSEHMIDEDLELSDIESQRGHFAREGWANRGSNLQAPRHEIPYDEDHEEEDEDDDEDEMNDDEDDEDQEAEEEESPEIEEDDQPPEA